MSEPQGPVSQPTPPGRRSWSDVGTRVASAFVLVALTIAALYFGGYFFAAVVGAVYAAAYREWEGMVSRAPLTPRGIAIIALIALSGLLYPVFGLAGWGGAIAAAFVVAATMSREDFLWRAAGIALFGLLIVGLLLIRHTSTAGIWAGLYLGIVVWMTDSAAFFTGRQIGGEKLAPDISPSKTWSGALGGLALGTGAGLVAWIVLTDSPIWIGLALSCAISILGQAGDLAESAIKRRFRIKDSGDLIPGHGGVMDRLDSLTFGVFVVVIVGAVHAGFGSVAEGLLYW